MVKPVKGSKETIDYSEVLDSVKWSSVHWKLFVIFADNYFFDGIMFAVAPLLLYLVTPSSIAPVVFALNLLSEAIGSIVLGKLADIYGRLKIFAFSMALEAGSLALLLFLYKSVIALAILTSLMTFGIGGEFGAAYALVAELSPARHRGKALLLITNFWNLGSAVIATLSIVYAKMTSNPNTQVEYLLLTALGTALGAGFARLTLPESPRWLVLKGKINDAKKIVEKITKYKGNLKFTIQHKEAEISLLEAIEKYFFRFLVLIIITLAQYITYDITAYYIPYAPGFVFGKKVVSYIVLYANIGASLGAFLILPFIDKSRRWSASASFLGGTITSIVLLITNMVKRLNFFYLDLFANMIFSEWAWGSLGILQSELFPTGVRSSVVGLLTGLQGISGALIVYFSLRANVSILFASIITLWFLGFFASLAWHKRGVESAKIGIEKLEIITKNK